MMVHQNQTTMTTLTPQRIRILNQIEFCWDATTALPTGKNQTTLVPEQPQEERQKKRNSRKRWWDYYDLLCEHCQNNKNNKDDLFALSKRVQLGIWLDRQRQLYRRQQQLGETTTTTVFTPEQLQALTQLHPDWWMSPREYQWECRYRELCAYPSNTTHRLPSSKKKKKRQKQTKQVSQDLQMNAQNNTNTTDDDDVEVPEMDSLIRVTDANNDTQRRIRICAEDNPVLARWVHRQRREYRHRCAGLPSAMTDERQEKLERIGFVWFPWV
jgi:hypothetical protein